MNKLTELVVDICVKIHKRIGPGCFERVYEELIYYELNKNKIQVDRQLLLPIIYESLIINDAYKLDLMLEKRLILEIKSIETVLPVHFQQVMTYLKLMNIKNGILLNFKVDLMKKGIHRVFNNSGT